MKIVTVEPAYPMLVRIALGGKKPCERCGGPVVLTVEIASSGASYKTEDAHEHAPTCAVLRERALRQDVVEALALLEHLPEGDEEIFWAAAACRYDHLLAELPKLSDETRKMLPPELISRVEAALRESQR